MATTSYMGCSSSRAAVPRSTAGTTCQYSLRRTTVTLKIRCSEHIGNAIMRLIASIEAIAPERLEDFHLEMGDDTPDRTGGGGPRTHYWAKLPRLGDGTFDQASIPDVVKENLLSLGATTVNGIIYQDIVDHTLRGDIATEPKLRAERMMKAGSSQRAVQQLFHNGLIDRGPIHYS